jgi:hypothetical protein
MTPELQAQLDALPPEAPARPEPSPLLNHLAALGLATAERFGPEEDDLEVTCHELVREQVRAWMAAHPEDRGELTEDAVRLAYGERLEAAFMASSTGT